MLKKRIIPCLDVHNGRTVKGINFEGIKDAGDPISMAKKYSDQGADELVFLDISATIESRKTMVALVERIAHEINIPFTVGGGISSVDDALKLIRAGADKISVNSAAVRKPSLLMDLKNELGSQCVVLAIDAKRDNTDWRVTTHGGRELTGLNAIEWAKEGAKLGAGEILLTSMEADGTKNGFDISLTEKISAAVDIPVIASGGAGCVADFYEVFTNTYATGALAASIFHYNQLSIPALKTALKSQNIPIR